MLSLPTLYTRDLLNNVRQWSIHADGATIMTVHGLHGGQLQTEVRTLTEGKNLGRSNETTPEQQAEREARAAWTKKCDSGYTTDPDAPREARPLLPMLAHPYQKHGDSFDWSHAYAQPKLDGTRCLALVGNGTASLFSRNGKEIKTMPHIVEAVSALNLPEGSILDGELFTQDLHFQEIVSAVKKVGANTERIQYHIYDQGDENAPFRSRNLWLINNVTPEDYSSPLKLVPTYRVTDMAAAMRYHELFVGEGYEGTMLRDGHSDYLFGYRSPALLKVKDFVDDEFVIVNHTQGSGREEGCIIFTCETPEGKSFDVRPMGTLEERKAMHSKADQYLNRPLTVRYQNLTKDGLPRFPVGVAVRDYE